MNFGTRADCEGYMQRVQKAQAAIANQKQITAGVSYDDLTEGRRG